MGQSDVRQAARRQAQAAERRYRDQIRARTVRLRHHAEAVIVALAERDAVVDQRNLVAGIALLAMTADEHLTLAEAVVWCSGTTHSGEPPKIPVVGSPASTSLSLSEARRLLRWARQSREVPEHGAAAPGRSVDPA